MINIYYKSENRVNVSNQGALTLFNLRKLRGVKMMCKIIEDFKISLIEDGKSPKTIESNEILNICNLSQVVYVYGEVFNKYNLGIILILN